MRRSSVKLRQLLIGILLAVMVITAVSMPSCSPTAAATGITLSSSVQVTFPTLLTFKVKAQSDANITDLRLHYTVSKENYAKVVSEGWAQFNPATSVDTQWPLDMRKAGLPPATQVQYWWTAEDAAGRTAQTSPATTSFDDNRYSWQTISSPPITLLWYNGDRTFANALLTSAQQGLKKIESDTGANPRGQVRIFIYASARDLQGAQLFAQAWEGGVTYEEYSLIAIGVPTNQLSYGQAAVPHELTHWVIGQMTRNNYGAGLPTWLDEGLAVYSEGPISADNQALLNYAIKNNQLISIRSLSSPFSAVPLQAYLSYAESVYVVTFMIQKYGTPKMLQLLDTFHQGATYDEALKQVYGFDQDGLDAQWRQSIGVKTVSTPQPQLALATAQRAGRLP